ncbi:MAG: hypothetical protein V3R98_02285 [Alphaproteobacteria bacterium]
MSLRKRRLELARTPEFPQGSANRGYEFIAPLTADGHFDDAEWRANRKKCTVRRLWPREDEPIFKFDRHRMVEGEYVTITEHDGVARTFRVVRVR